MKKIPFYIVDVFAESQYQGNQLAVFFKAETLSQEEMQTLTQEINFQESTFVIGDVPSAHGFKVKIFTPEYEMPFAGHPTLGTASVINQVLMNGNASSLRLDLKVGSIPVDFVKDAKGAEIVWLTAKSPSFSGNYNKHDLAYLLGITPEDIEDTYPIETVSTGISFMMVPLKSLKAVKKVKIDLEGYEQFLLKNQLHKTNSPSGIHTMLFIFSKETYSAENQINARMILPENGMVREDPATGSANSCLLAYLLKNNFFNAKHLNISVEQGYEIHRPSRLYLHGNLNEQGEYLLKVGGKVQWVASGEWVINR
ncbi:MAG: PhzF family phenazine biosynthesis protein [Thermoflexibacter sp.]|jgi:trans-2,3-dihydro-3-hydroxyanthranilate isomerase|nr:PhzF family phenazine biosynthesis protein [Thermoflexibacter sp.]